jgi:hypothetical protein
MVRTFLSATLLIAFGVVSASAAGPCDLLTEADIQEATGKTVASSKINSHNKAVCDYVMGEATFVLNVSLTDKGPADSAEKMVAELQKRKIAAKTVAGLGDGAYTSSPGYGMQQAGVYKGSKHAIVTVMMMGAPEAKSKEAADKLIRKALARL